VVDDSQEHAQQNEVNENNEQHEKYRTKDGVSFGHLTDVEVAQCNTKQREPCIANNNNNKNSV